MRKFIDIVEGEVVPLFRPGTLSRADHDLASDYHFACADEVRTAQEHANHLWAARYHEGKASGEAIEPKWNAMQAYDHAWAVKHHENEYAWLKRNLRGKEGIDWQAFHEKLAAYHRRFT